MTSRLSLPPVWLTRVFGLLDARIPSEACVDNPIPFVQDVLNAGWVDWWQNNLTITNTVSASVELVGPNGLIHATKPGFVEVVVDAHITFLAVGALSAVFELLNNKLDVVPVINTLLRGFASSGNLGFYSQGSAVVGSGVVVGATASEQAALPNARIHVPPPPYNLRLLHSLVAAGEFITVSMLGISVPTGPRPY